MTTPNVKNSVECTLCQTMFVPSKQFAEHVVPRYLPSGKLSNRIIRPRVCDNCSFNRGFEDFQDSKTFKNSPNQKCLEPFLISMSEIEALAKVPPPEKGLRDAMLRLLFANAITVLETYLGDTYIVRVVSDEATLIKCLKETPELARQQVSLSEIPQRFGRLKEDVRAYLQGVTYHNLPRVAAMYKSVLGLRFPDLRLLIQAVDRRHDIVHRGGKTKDGQAVKVSPSDLSFLLRNLKMFVNNLEDQMAGGLSA